MITIAHGSLTNSLARGNIRQDDEREARTVYVIQSESFPDEYYVGVTSDLRFRLEAHNAGRSRQTAKYVPWRVVIAIGFAVDDWAFQFEKYLKSCSGRAFLKRHFI